MRLIEYAFTERERERERERQRDRQKERQNRTNLDARGREIVQEGEREGQRE